MTRNVALEFYNAESKPSVVRLSCTRCSVYPIMVWYGAYFSGDDYAVMIDGVEVPKDLNGEFEHVTVEAKSMTHINQSLDLDQTGEKT